MDRNIRTSVVLICSQTEGLQTFVHHPSLKKQLDADGLIKTTQQPLTTHDHSTQHHSANQPLAEKAALSLWTNQQPRRSPTGKLSGIRPFGIFRIVLLKTGKVSSTDAKHHGSVEPDAEKLYSFPSSQLASTNYSFSYGAVTGLDVHNNRSPRNCEREREREEKIWAQKRLQDAPSAIWWSPSPSEAPTCAAPGSVHSGRVFVAFKSHLKVKSGVPDEESSFCRCSPAATGNFLWVRTDSEKKSSSTSRYSET